MNERNNYAGNDTRQARNQGYDDWPPPDDFRGIRIAILGIFLLGLLGGGGWLAYRVLAPTDPRDVALDYMAVGDYRAAITELNGVIEQFPNDAEVRWLLGNAHSYLGENSYALSQWEAAYSMGYYEPPLLLALTNAKLADGEDEAALALIRQWADVDSNLELAKWEVLRARALLNLGKDPLATESFVKALKFDPENIDAKRGLAYTGISEELAASVGGDLDKALSTGLGQPETWVLKGDLAFSRGDLDAAQQAFEQAVKVGSNNVYALVGLARVYLVSVQTDAAAGPIAVLEQRFPRHAGGAYVRALYAQQRQDYQHALDTVRIVLNQDPNHALGILLMGEVQQAMGDHEQALLNLNRFHRIAPDSVRGRKSLAIAFMDNGQPERAVELLESLVDQQHADPEVAAVLAAAYTRLGDLDKARAYAAPSGELSPDR